MSKKMFSSEDRSRIEETIKTHTHLSEKTVNELTDALVDLWDTADERAYNSKAIDEYLDELEERD